MLVVTGSAAKEVTQFIVLAAKTVGRTMLFEATHTLDPSLRDLVDQLAAAELPRGFGRD